MSTADVLINYIESSSAITFIVIAWLSIYFILIVWVYLYRNASLKSRLKKEQNSLESIYLGGAKIEDTSALHPCFQKSNVPSLEQMNVCKNEIIKDATVGLTLFSIVASTAPFIGLFGTVVSILESFSQLGGETRASLEVIAPVISEALIATAAGIFVAIPAYSFHLMLKRKAYELSVLVQMQIDLILSYRKKTHV